MRILHSILATVLMIPAALAADAKHGQTVYDRECKECHAMNGAPIASVARSMAKQGVKMRDLKAAEVQSSSDADWKKQVNDGTGKMKPVKTVTAAELDDVIAYMRTLKK